MAILFDGVERFSLIWKEATTATFLWCLNHIGPRVQEELALKAYYSRFSIFSPGGHFVHRSETVLAISVEGHLSNIPMKFK